VTDHRHSSILYSRSPSRGQHCSARSLCLTSGNQTVHVLTPAGGRTQCSTASRDGNGPLYLCCSSFTSALSPSRLISCHTFNQVQQPRKQFGLRCTLPPRSFTSCSETYTHSLRIQTLSCATPLAINVEKRHESQVDANLSQDSLTGFSASRSFKINSLLCHSSPA